MVCLIVSVTVLMGVGAASAGLASDPALVIRFSFDDLTTVVPDLSGRGHDGTVRGDVIPFTDEGRRAAQFLGTMGPAGFSYLDLDGASVPAEDCPTAAITLAAWVECENTGGHHAIFNAQASDATWVIHPELRSDGRFRWLLRAAGNLTLFDIQAGTVTWGEWLHYTGTYDKATGKAILYVNTQVVEAKTVANPRDIAPNWGAGARVGFNVDNARPFTGLMDEFCLFKRALSMAELAGTGRTIYVDADATGANDGSSWARAYTYLQDALDDAVLAEKPLEIWVAEGIYKPDQGRSYTLGDREAAFELINGLILAGGYAGLVGVEPDARDTGTYETVLSGDLEGNDAAGAYDLLAEPTRAENSYHVVTSSGTDGTAGLDGFAIMGGNANGSRSNNSTGEEDRLTHGGGLHSISGNPSVVNCTFRENSARYGGGISNSRSNPALASCAFRRNYAERYGGGMDNSQSNASVINCTFTSNSSSWGGGMSNRAQSDATVSDSTFRENRTSWYGGGMINVDSDVTLSRCTFRANEARLGGGMRNSQSSPALANCLFVDNVAYCLYGWYGLAPLDGQGGGMFNSNSTPALTNCTFSGNCAGEYAGGICNVESFGAMVNCILWGNSLPQVSGDPIVCYSNIEGGWPGEGNLNTDPLFADSANGDCHLKSRVGRWDPLRECWVADDLSSPCIDAGDPSIPVGDEPQPNGARINMGAYGGTAEASKSR